MADEPLLRPEEVASVLAQEGDAALADASSESGRTVYSLRRPVAIPPEGEAEALARAGRFATALRDVLRRDLESPELEIELGGFRQEQAGVALRGLPDPAWVLSFVHADGGGISLAVEPVCALALVEMALGGLGAASDSARGPTPLERRVLQKLCISMTGPLGQAVGESFCEGRFDSPAPPGRVAAPGQTVGVALLKLKVAETECNGVLLATAGILREPDESERKKSSLRIGPLASNLEGVPIEVRPVLEAGSISFADLVGLEPGVVIRLEAREHRPLQLRLEGETLFCGSLSRGDDGAEFHVTWRRGRHPAEPRIPAVSRQSGPSAGGSEEEA